MRRRTPFIVVLPLLAACSSGAKGLDMAGADTAEQDEASDGGAGGGNWDSGGAEDAEEGAAFWRLDADLQITAGDLAVDGTGLQATLLDDTGVELCTLAGTPAEVTPFLTLPDELLITWWSVSAVSWQGDCAQDPGGSMLPDSLALGVGELHPEIVAVLDGMPEADDGAGGALNGAYAQLAEGGTLYVFGAVGPSTAWLGEGEAATTAPISDGVWELRGAYSFPL